jgi:hypothetical protein
MKLKLMVKMVEDSKTNLTILVWDVTEEIFSPIPAKEIFILDMSTPMNSKAYLKTKEPRGQKLVGVQNKI